MISLFSNTIKAEYKNLAYDFKFNDINGNELNLSKYKDKVIVVINVASKCGFTKQYNDMQSIWVKYKKRGLVVIAVPSNDFNQENEDNENIKKFCETNFGITFPMTEKISVKGDKAHPFYQWAKENFGNTAIPKWNFHKIIINRQGKVEKTFFSITKPTSRKFIKEIERLL